MAVRRVSNMAMEFVNPDHDLTFRRCVAAGLPDPDELRGPEAEVTGVELAELGGGAGGGIVGFASVAGDLRCIDLWDDCIVMEDRQGLQFQLTTVKASDSRYNRGFLRADLQPRPPVRSGHQH